jgi:hypothetical protein
MFSLQELFFYRSGIDPRSMLPAGSLGMGKTVINASSPNFTVRGRIFTGG